MALRSLFGQAIGGLGRKLGLPEFGISEKISGYGKPTGLTSAGERPVQIPSITAGGPALSVSGQVKGAVAPQLGGGGNMSQPAPQQQPGGGGGEQPVGQPSFENVPQEPQFDFGAINEALSSLGNLESETRSLLGGGEKQAETFRGAAEARATGEKARGKAAISEQERKTQVAGREAETQQRRGFSEIAQQFLGRFGRGAFGQGVTGALGESVLQNVGRIRSGVQETMQQLFAQKENIETQFNTALEQASFQSENLKQSARGQLQQALGEIGARRVALQSQKADLINQSLENYRQQIVNINARNAQFQQQIDLARTRTDEAIREAQSRAASTLNNLASFSLAPGETKIMPLAGIGGEEGAQAFAGTQLPQGTSFNQAGQFGIFSAQAKEDPYEAFLRSQGVGGQ